MSKIQKSVMQRFFRDAAGDATRLPWHSEEPPPFLARAVDARALARDGGGRALDVGCGSGHFAACMAELGLAVTAIDYIPDAVAMARETCRRRGVAVDVVEADALEYRPDEPFDLVFDSGCLHNMSGAELAAYRRRLAHWLAPGGDYLLGHWGRRHFLDWRPIGPRRRRPEEIERIVGPDVELVDFSEVDERVPLPFGPWVRMASYWFRRGTPPN